MKPPNNFQVKSRKPSRNSDQRKLRALDSEKDGASLVLRDNPTQLKREEK